MANGDEAGAIATLIVEEIFNECMLYIVVVLITLLKRASKKRKRRLSGYHYSLLQRIPEQVTHMTRLVNLGDAECLSNLRMDRNAFGRLCLLLQQLGGLADSKYVGVEEQVAMFLCVLAHHKKNRVVGFDFMRSGETVSYYVHKVIHALLKLHSLFLAKPAPVDNTCQDPRWKCFKGCLGALDGTHIQVTVPNIDKPRFRNRKGQISTNTLAVCDINMRFTYILPGWEGSAADGRVLRDAVNRLHGLKVPKGNYYLCDNGYANSDGFLTPHKNVRYHLKEWGPDSDKPTSPIELYNMRHTKARNVIERAFGLMKMRWGILRSPSFYPLKVQVRLIMCCFLLHNFVRSEMSSDPYESLVDGLGAELDNEDGLDDDEFVDTIEQSTDWSRFREELAESMWMDYQNAY